MKNHAKLLFYMLLVYLFTTGCKKGEFHIGPRVFRVQSDTFKDVLTISSGDKPADELIASPQLSWKGAPLGTAHFIIIMDDNNPQKPHIWWTASVSNTLSSLIKVNTKQSILPDLIPMVLPLSKPFIPIFFPDPNQGALTNIMPYSDGNRWNTASSCTLEIFALQSTFSHADYAKFKSRCYMMEMTRSAFREFCKSVSVDILDSAKITYAVKHLDPPVSARR
jgi:hypothetical protein